MSNEHRRDSAEVEADDQAQSKTDEERELEQEWSQGGQDVEEAQHEEPSGAE